MSRWEVMVWNIGTVYSGSVEDEAREEYRDYVEASKTGVGVAAFGERVALFHDGQIAETYEPPIERRTGYIRIPVTYDLQPTDIEDIGFIIDLILQKALADGAFVGLGKVEIGESETGGPW